MADTQQYAPEEWLTALERVEAKYRAWYRFATATVLITGFGLIGLAIWYTLSYSWVYSIFGAIGILALLSLLSRGRSPAATGPNRLRYRPKQFDLAQLVPRLISGEITGNELWEQAIKGARWQFPHRDYITPEFAFSQLIRHVRIYLFPPLAKMYRGCIWSAFVLTLFILYAPYISDIHKYISYYWQPILTIVIPLFLVCWGIFIRVRTKTALNSVIPYLRIKFAQLTSSVIESNLESDSLTAISVGYPALTLIQIDQMFPVRLLLSAMPFVIWGVISDLILVFNIELGTYGQFTPSYQPMPVLMRLIIEGSPILLGLILAWVMLYWKTQSYRTYIRKQLEGSTLASRVVNGELYADQIRELAPNHMRWLVNPSTIPLLPGNQLGNTITTTGLNLDCYLSPPKRLIRPSWFCNVIAGVMLICALVTGIWSMPWSLAVSYLLILLAGGLMVPAVLHGIRASIWLEEFVDYLADCILA